jgi:hypothetical protein
MVPRGTATDVKATKGNICSRFVVVVSVLP